MAEIATDALRGEETPDQSAFAIVKTGGKQYRVECGDVLVIEKLSVAPGEKIQFNEVLAIGGAKPTFGSPFIKGAGVQAEVLEQVKGPKVINFVRRRRKHSSKRTKGHRQQHTVVRITAIVPKQAATLKDSAGAGVTRM